jgi:hypothetical protein
MGRHDSIGVECAVSGQALVADVGGIVEFGGVREETDFEKDDDEESLLAGRRTSCKRWMDL